MQTRIKELRKKKGFTQFQIASQLNCSANVYSRYERGERQIPLDVLISLSKIYEVSVDYIIGNESSKEIYLSDQEINFIEVYRNADDRAQSDAIRLLRYYNILKK